MLIGDNGVFVERLKTGSTHIRRQLKACWAGTARASTTSPATSGAAIDRVIIGSARDRSWYLSWWSCGFQRRGSPRTRLLDAQNWPRGLPLQLARVDRGIKPSRSTAATSSSGPGHVPARRWAELPRWPTIAP
ncbi:hypothetical protein [Ideonella sp. B508-1]|uniref:hypothetical protein n=1 Tax=Ideonella sp. B508-1 TaxID=137716 RepID=UPI000348EB31|nr:hypothetical protein [Ideonella sp. B508-1]